MSAREDLEAFLDEGDIERAAKRLASAVAFAPSRQAIIDAVDKEAAHLVARAVIRRAINEFMAKAKRLHDEAEGRD